MQSFNAKLIVLLIAMLIIVILMPFDKVFATNDGIQLIQMSNGDIVVYVDGLEKTAFDYAITSSDNATDMDLNYTNSVQDGENNQVALITAEDYAEYVKNTNNYLYIRTEDNNVLHIQLDFSNMFTQEEMSLVENTTKRIATEEAENLSSREETINDIKYTYTVGGLKITDDKNATYFYILVKLPTEGYSELQNLATELNDSNKTMCEKIELANNFYNQYNTLIENAENENSWQAAENMQILQPEDYDKEEQYVVMLKKVAKDGTTTYDAKFMKTYNSENEEMAPASTKEVKTQETSKLPITGDSVALFVLLAVLVVIAIVVFIRIKKLNKKADK